MRADRLRAVENPGAMMLHPIGFVTVVGVVVLFGACAAGPPPSASQVGTVSVTSARVVPAEGMTASRFVPPSQTKRTGCVAARGLPDSACTPGAVMTMDLGIICNGSARERRHVGPELHRQVFAEYGIAYPQPRGAYESIT